MARPRKQLKEDTKVLAQDLSLATQDLLALAKRKFPRAVDFTVVTIHGVEHVEMKLPDGSTQLFDKAF